MPPADEHRRRHLCLQTIEPCRTRALLAAALQGAEPGRQQRDARQVPRLRRVAPSAFYRRAAGPSASQRRPGLDNVELHHRGCSVARTSRAGADRTDGQTEVWLDGAPVTALDTTQSLGTNPPAVFRSATTRRAGPTTSRSTTRRSAGRSSATPGPEVPRRSRSASCRPSRRAPRRTASMAACSPSRRARLRCQHPTSSRWEPRGERQAGRRDRNGRSRCRWRKPGRPGQRRVRRPAIRPAHRREARSDLADYGGELQVIAALRITDRYNGPFSDEPATASEVPWPSP